MLQRLYYLWMTSGFTWFKTEAQHGHQSFWQPLEGLACSMAGLSFLSASNIGMTLLQAQLSMGWQEPNLNSCSHYLYGYTAATVC